VERKKYIFSKNEKKEADEKNLIFFEDIKEYSGDAYVQQICKIHFGENKYQPTKYQLDLSNEIVYNSDIVSRKYKFFKSAVFLDIIAFFLLSVSILLA